MCLSLDTFVDRDTSHGIVSERSNEDREHRRTQTSQMTSAAKSMGKRPASTDLIDLIADEAATSNTSR